MIDRTLEKLRTELEDWRAQVGHLRVQANLGKREAKDRLRDLEQRLEPAYTKAKTHLESLAANGVEETRTLVKSLLAGWNEVWRAHRELSEESRRANELREEAERASRRR